MCLVSLLFFVSMELRLGDSQQGGVKHQYLNGNEKSACVGTHLAVQKGGEGPAQTITLSLGLFLAVVETLGHNKPVCH